MKKQGPYKCVDKANNNWMCEVCYHMEKFEADGPIENGWNVCPVCLTPLRRGEDDV